MTFIKFNFIFSGRRASVHLEAVVKSLLESEYSNGSSSTERSLWEFAILSLAREVVLHVDPDVVAGDSMDITQYVKIKTIPGLIQVIYDNKICVRKREATEPFLSYDAYV